MQIRIDTQHTREIAQRLTAEGDRLAEIGHELQRAIGSLDTWAWDGRSRWRAEPLLNRVRPESARVANGLDELGRKLVRVADTFEQEDNTAARNLAGMGWVDFETGGAAGDNGMIGEGLFVNGPTLDDIKQGDLGDCYLIAALGALAYMSPEYIHRAIKKNPDGTYSVTFYERAEQGGYTAIDPPIVVTPDFPMSDDLDENGNPKPFATSTDEDEVWVSLIEKAYVKWKTGGTKRENYEAIEGGWPGEVMESLTGRESYSIKKLHALSTDKLGEEIRWALGRGKPVTVGIKPTTKQRLDAGLDELDKSLLNIIPDKWRFVDDTADVLHGGSADLVGNHGYVVKSIEGDQVTLYNPWSRGPKQSDGQYRPAEFTISVSDLQKSASRIEYCDVPTLVDTPIPGTGTVYA